MDPWGRGGASGNIATMNSISWRKRKGGEERRGDSVV